MRLVTTTTKNAPRCFQLHVQATMDDAAVAKPPEATPLGIPEMNLTPDDQDKLQKQIINGVFLALSFGYAVYTILNIDHGMTRGWTHEEMLLRYVRNSRLVVKDACMHGIVMIDSPHFSFLFDHQSIHSIRIPLDNWNNYETSLAEKPIFTKTLINVIIYLLGDWLSQTVFQKKNVLDFDIMRTLRNGFIGLCFGPLVHQYYEWSDYILPVEGGFWNRAEKILMDQTIYLVIKCSIYISAVGLLRGDSWKDVKQNVQDRIGGIVFTAWKFWPLVHCITYGLIPARHRILWVNSVDLIWNAILATQAQKQGPEPQPADVEQPLLAAAASTDVTLPVDEGLLEITLTESVPSLMKEFAAAEEAAMLLTTTTTTTLADMTLNDDVMLETEAVLSSSRNTTFATLDSN